MKNPHIYISKEGELLLIEAPEKPEMPEDYGGSYQKEIDDYDQALSEAIKVGVPFKDQEGVKTILFRVGTFNLFDNAVGQIFPLPPGYTTEVKTEDASHVNWSLVRQVAILLPSQAVVDTSVEPKEEPELFTSRELEIAFCIGMLNQKDLDIDKLSDQLSHAKFDLVEEYIKSLRTKL